MKVKVEPRYRAVLSEVLEGGAALRSCHIAELKGSCRRGRLFWWTEVILWRGVLRLLIMRCGRRCRHKVGGR